MKRGLYILVSTKNGRFFKEFLDGGPMYCTTLYFDEAKKFRSRDEAEEVGAELNSNGSTFVAMGVDEE